MKITEIRTLWVEEVPDLLWVEVDTDQGLTGLGESYYGPAAAAAFIHQTAAPLLLGGDPRTIERHRHALYHVSFGARFGSTGAETRGASMLDTACWDIFAQAVGVPLYQLLGGRTREAIRAYANTSWAWRYERAPDAPYRDATFWHEQPGDYAESLLADGFTTTKLFPQGHPFIGPGLLEARSLTPDELESLCAPMCEMQARVGSRLDIAIDLDCHWGLTAAKQIVRAIEPFAPLWIEDPLPTDGIADWVELARGTTIPITISERIGGRWSFREVFEARCFGYVMLDPGWIGGVSEARVVATMAEAHRLPVTMHDTGPVGLALGVHLGVSQPTAVLQEMMRDTYYDLYPRLVTDLPALDRGFLRPPAGPGIGTRLHPELWERPDAHVQISRMNGRHP